MNEIFVSHKQVDRGYLHLIRFYFDSHPHLKFTYDEINKKTEKIDPAITKLIDISNLVVVIHTENTYTYKRKFKEYHYANEVQREIDYANTIKKPVVFFRDRRTDKVSIPEVIKPDRRILDIDFDRNDIAPGLEDLSTYIYYILKLDRPNRKSENLIVYPDTILSRLNKVLNEPSKKVLTEPSKVEWMLSYITENNIDQLAKFTDSFRAQLISAKPEKLINSGFFYWGPGSTRMWDIVAKHHEATDKKTFIPTWGLIYENSLKDLTLNYISLGVGAGEKDEAILKMLSLVNKNLFYIPIDMSAPMLKLASKITLGNSVSFNNVLPIEANFYDTEKNPEIKKLILKLTNGTSCLYSLLGNTLANSADDVNSLNIIFDLMNEGDFLLLELSYIEGLPYEYTITEYKTRLDFKKFVLSTVLSNTNLPIDLKATHYHCEFEWTFSDGRSQRFKFEKYKSKLKKEEPSIANEKALEKCDSDINYYFHTNKEEREMDGNTIIRELKIKGFYQNSDLGGEIITSDWEEMKIDNEKINLLLFISRKYTHEGVNYLINKTNFKNKLVCAFDKSSHTPGKYEDIGNKLILLQKK